MAGGIPPEAQPNLRGNGAASATTNIQQANGNVLSAVPPIFRGIHDLFKKTPAEILTQFTGGRMYNFARERGLEEAITDIGKDLNSQYVLSYSPNNKDEPASTTSKCRWIVQACRQDTSWLLVGWRPDPVKRSAPKLTTLCGSICHW